MDYEIAAINISVNNQSVPVYTAPKQEDDSLPAFAWHRDSYPFVCVTMLSDCVGMTGGETALKTATGEILKVRGPAMVLLLHSIFQIPLLIILSRELPSLCRGGISSTKP